MKHSDVKNETFQGLQSNCSRCALKKRNHCPYLEEIAHCPMFIDAGGPKPFNGVHEEKRRHRRKHTSIPAFMKHKNLGAAKVPVGSIMDISLSGLRISMPREITYKVLTPEFEIVFTLPGEKRPLCVHCKLRHEVYSEDAVHVGVSFIDAGSRGHESLVNFLM